MGRAIESIFYLLLTLEDLDLVATWSWGRSALGWMYLNMSEISTGQSPSCLCGLMLSMGGMYLYFIFLFSFEFIAYLFICILTLSCSFSFVGVVL